MMNLLSILLLILTLATHKAHGDTAAECPQWAEMGECTLNPNYMSEHCADACRLQADKDRDMAAEIEKKIGHINSFFELEAQDIDEKLIKFDQFKGQVTVVANVASYCGYTESHYRGLNKLYDTFKGSSIPLNILAFPCNQFGEQEPETCPKIKQFAANNGVQFQMMNKVDVNGPDAHPVYLFMKKVAGPPRIRWNFGTYFVVTTDGAVASFSGVEPMELVPAIQQAMGVSNVEL